MNTAILEDQFSDTIEEDLMKVDLLKNHPDCIPRLSEVWHEVLGKVWIPDVQIEDVIKRFKEHLNEDSLPLTLVAFEENLPVGMCSLRVNDGILPELGRYKI